MDQALEKAYNKPSKGVGGIIGISRQKEAVSKWNLIKHEKYRYASTLVDYSGYNDNDEYSIHHELSEKKSEYDNECVEQIKCYISTKGNPFDPSDADIKNLVTRTQFPAEECTFVLNCLELGESKYAEFVKNCFVKKKPKTF